MTDLIPGGLYAKKNADGSVSVGVLKSYRRLPNGTDMGLVETYGAQDVPLTSRDDAGWVYVGGGAPWKDVAKKLG